MQLGRSVDGMMMAMTDPDGDLALVTSYRELSATASFNNWAGFEVVHMGDGECELRMDWRPEEMGQYAGFLHAGIVAALLDTACGFAANTKATGVLASNLSVNYLAPAVGDAFVATGRVVKAGRKQIFTTGELHAVANGQRRLAATATAILVPAG